MLKFNNNLIFIINIYILVLLLEVAHFGSDVNVIIMLESFFCFSVLLFLLSSGLQDLFFLGISIITSNFSYIHIFFKNITTLNVQFYNIFFFILSIYLVFLIKNYKFYKNVKDNLKNVYLYMLLINKKKIKHFLKKRIFVLQLFI